MSAIEQVFADIQTLAQQVMGWEWHDNSADAYPQAGGWFTAEGEWIGAMWDPKQRIEDAWMLVDKLGLRAHITRCADGSGRCVFLAEDARTVLADAIGKTIPLAICRAALLLAPGGREGGEGDP